MSRLTDAEREALRGLGQGQVPAVVERIIADRLEAQREEIASSINDAALHVMATADSDIGAALTASILERAARIAREAGA